MKFGDVFLNYSVEKNDRRRIGIFVWYSGSDIYATDGDGDFWHVGRNSKIKVIGNSNVLNEYFAAIVNDTGEVFK